MSRATTPAADVAMQALRQRMDGMDGMDARGPRFWRALEELADDAHWRDTLHTALPQLAALAPMDRRRFIKLLGASLALAGLAACSSPPQEQLVPWLRQPEGMAADTARFYASALACAGDVCGVLVETHMGRPTKIEGNPAHPASLGGSAPALQAAVLELWDPDRSQTPLHRGVAATWDELFGELATLSTADGRGLRVLSGAIVSPTLAAQRDALLQKFPGARWHQHEAAGQGQTLAGTALAFGTPLQPIHHFDKARRIVALDADFLGSMPGRLAYARAFAQQRKPPQMNRLYAVEPTPSLTGAMADHCWPLAYHEVGAFARQLAGLLGVGSAAGAGVDEKLARAVADDLLAHKGQSLVLAGETQPPPVHALAHLLNQALGNIGHTVDYIAPTETADPADSLASLCTAMNAGEVGTLLVLDANPAYDAPADLPFAQAMTKVPRRIHLGLYRDETAQLCDWHLPMAHALESWSDLRAWDGTVSIVQPLIEPLYAGRSMHQLLAAMLGQPMDIRALLQTRWHPDDDESWNRSLREGLIAESGTTLTKPPAIDAGFLAAPTLPPASPAEFELLFRPDPTLWDGRYANNGWLQELPKPLSQLTWGNAALISPALAAERKLANGDVVALRVGDRQLRAPVWIMPGQAARSVTVHLGHGRRHAGHVGDGVGFDAYGLRSHAAPWREGGLQMHATGERIELAATQHHHAMEGRAPVRAGTLAEYLQNAKFLQPEEPATPPSLYPPKPPGEYAWGMAIDLNACIGCKGCTIACQAENNIPIVGADQVKRGREMHWIRVDRYYEGSAQAPHTHHQPVPCMHCEHAPCEVVCPVGATVHDAEGLNLQVYNRCVGTRFCSNNCPYKVRRFNFLQYADVKTESLKAQRNPDVSVRNRGVMEKCTYCIQRIQTAHIAADREGRAIPDGEIVTACQAACPTQAITFGNIADPNSAVSHAKASPLDYSLLAELNTRPRTSYGAHLRNPNPALEDDA
jgi:molybdopterin-containing oxidoreductase family iron-sulfur binding subunit